MIEQVFDFKNQKYNSLEDIKDKLDYFRSLSQNGLHHLNKLELEKLKMEFLSSTYKCNFLGADNKQ